MLTNEDLQKIERIFEKKLDTRLKLSEDKLEKKLDTRLNESKTYLDERLGEFADDVLLPGMEEIIKREIGAHRYDMKVYIDSKIGEAKGDIVSYIKPMTEKEKEWKRTVIDVLERHKLAKQQELKKLADSVGIKFRD